jgi:hypothetical protein
MSNNDLTGIQLAAALAEHVYRRGIDDNPITLSDLQVTAAPVVRSARSFSPSCGASELGAVTRGRSTGQLTSIARCLLWIT